MTEPLGSLLGEADEVYLTFAETPHDVLPPGWEPGNDAVHENDHPKALALAREISPHEVFITPVGLTPGPRRVIVPHPRDLKKGMSGDDVLALQRALAADHLRKWGSFTRSAGEGVVAEVKKFQSSAGIKATGIYDEATHRKLTPFYDAYGIWLLTQASAKEASKRAEQAVLASAMNAYNFRDRLHYTQGPLRWMLIAQHIRDTAIPAQRSMWADCSSWFTWVYWNIGGPDPNELHFTGGYTGTLGSHGKVVSNHSKAPVGSAFLYGPGTHHHVQLGLGGENTIGNGSESGPHYLPAGAINGLDVVRSYPLK